MGKGSRWCAPWAVLAMVISACGAPPSPVGLEGARPESESAELRRVVIGIQGAIPSFAPGAGGPVPGKGEVKELVQVGLTTASPGGVRVPRLGEAVPSVENGLWKVFPDGRMETSWRIRSGVRWQDGTPFTADDAVFGTRLDLDDNLPGSRHVGYRSIESVEAPDSLTVTVKWKNVFLQADQMFGGFADPMPRHLLEAPWRAEDPDKFMALPFWNEAFVGTGPFKVRDWVVGSHMVLTAHDGYALGRPRIDLIEIKFIPDSAVLVASILANAVELTVGRGLSFEQAGELRHRWAAGSVHSSPTNPVVMYPQLRTPNPAVVGDVQFRRALLHALDRQELVDFVLAGQSAVAHATILRPGDALYAELERAIVRYDYAPQRATALIDGLGLPKGADGFYRDRAGQKLSVEIRTTGGEDTHLKAIHAAADAWQRVGVEVEITFVPAGRRDDREYRNTFPAFDLRRNPHTPEDLERFFHGRQVPLPENNYRGSAYTGYMNPQWDALIDRFNTTVPRAERVQVLEQIVRHLTEQVLILGLFYDLESTAIGNRLKNVMGRTSGSGEAWNAHEWEVRRGG